MTESIGDEFPEEFVMIASDIIDLDPVLDHTDHSTNNKAIIIIPENSFFHFPAIDDIPDKIKGFRFYVSKEMQKLFGFAVFASQVKIRYKQRSNFLSIMAHLSSPYTKLF
jgi:hypothetical protein